MRTDVIELSNKISFAIKHNLDEYGLSIQAALDNWLARTNDYSAQSFCDYVTSKNPGILKATVIWAIDNSS